MNQSTDEGEPDDLRNIPWVHQRPPVADYTAPVLKTCLVVAATETRAPRVLKSNRHRSPYHGLDSIGRKGYLLFGGRVEVHAPMHPEGELLYAPSQEKRIWSRCEDNPTFNRQSPDNDARALREACELMVDLPPKRER